MCMGKDTTAQQSTEQLRTAQKQQGGDAPKHKQAGGW